MRIDISGHQMEVTAALREYAQEKLAGGSDKLKKQAAEWIERSVRTKLVYLDIEAQASFAYGALGVYKAERLGSACDGRF